MKDVGVRLADFERAADPEKLPAAPAPVRDDALPPEGFTRVPGR